MSSAVSNGTNLFQHPDKWWVHWRFPQGTSLGGTTQHILLTKWKNHLVQGAYQKLHMDVVESNFSSQEKAKLVWAQFLVMFPIRMRFKCKRPKCSVMKAIVGALSRTWTWRPPEFVCKKAFKILVFLRENNINNSYSFIYTYKALCTCSKNNNSKLKNTMFLKH